MTWSQGTGGFVVQFAHARPPEVQSMKVSLDEQPGTFRVPLTGLTWGKNRLQKKVIQPIQHKSWHDIKTCQNDQPPALRLNFFIMFLNRDQVGNDSPQR